MRLILIIILTTKFFTTYSQQRTGRLTDKEILRNEEVILDLATFMIETKTKRLIYDSLDDDDVLKSKMKKLGVENIRLRYERNDFDPGDSTVRFNLPLKDLYRDCGEDIIYDFSKYGKNYFNRSDDKREFKKIKGRIYYRKDCDVSVRPKKKSYNKKFMQLRGVVYISNVVRSRGDNFAAGRL